MSGIVVLDTSGVAAVAAAGALVTATGAAGALGYAGWAITDRLWSARSRRGSTATSSELEASK
jgi:hypothetical protein